MNNCKHLPTLHCGFLILCLLVLGAPLAAMAAETHTRGMTLTAPTLLP